MAYDAVLEKDTQQQVLEKSRDRRPAMLSFPSSLVGERRAERRLETTDYTHGRRRAGDDGALYSPRLTRRRVIFGREPAV
jgi:hypothetical protein